MHQPSPVRTAFTLMELLMVIAIIATLMGLLIPVVSIAQGKAKQAKAATLIANVRSALEKYYNANAVYPEWNMGTVQAASLVNWSANASNLATAIETVAREDFPGGSDLKDPWGTVIHYRPAKSLPFDPATSIVIDSAKPPGADTYQVWSIGKNKRDDAATGTDPKLFGDDIVGWK